MTRHHSLLASGAQPFLTPLFKPDGRLSRWPKGAGRSLQVVDLSVMSNPPTIAHLTQVSPTLSAGVRTQYSPLATAHRYVGVPLIPHPVAGAGYYIPSNESGTSAAAAWTTYEFQSASSFVEVRTLCSNAQFMISVADAGAHDYHPIRSTAFSNDASGSTQFVDMDWSADAQPNKNRFYRVSGYNFAWGGIYVKTDGLSPAASYPTYRDSLSLMAWMGDSYPMGTGSFLDVQHVAPLISRLLGFDHWHDGRGGTGWASTSVDVPTARSTRYAKRVRAGPAAAGVTAPSYIVSSLGYNDSGNAAGVITPYDNWCPDIKTAYPAAGVISLGPWTPLGSTANLDAVKANISARAAAGGASFVDIADIVNAGNKALYTGGDNQHPNAAGHEFLARSIAPLILPLI